MQLDWSNFLSLGFLFFLHAFTVLALGHVLLNKSNPRSALTWTIALLFLPGIGVLLYVIFGISRAESRAAYYMRKAKLKAEHQAEYWQCDEMSKKTLGHVQSSSIPPRFLALSYIGRKLTNKPLSGGNSIHPLYNGDSAYPNMLQTIEEAEDYVYLTTFIFNGGEIGEKFVKALAQAAQRGVDVRLMVDGLGQFYSRTRVWRVLKDSGVQVVRFLPPRLFPPNFSINLRNHRKVLVADGWGFTGGMNIADYHVRSHENFSVQDVHFLCSGPIVTQLREAFLLDWGFCTNNYAVSQRKTEEMCGDVLCRMVLDGPGSGKDPLHELFFSAISAAHSCVCIMTPYFLPSHEVMGALKSAALRGVEVHIILPAKNNIFAVHWATYHLLPTLLESGVRVFYQDPPFAHTKLFVVDDYYVQIGSANFDARSLRLNFELNVECFDTSFARQIKEYFDIVLLESREYTMQDVEKVSLPKRLIHAACWIFSPYL